MPDMSESWQWLADNTNRSDYSGDLPGSIARADVFIGVSAPNLLTGDDLARMAEKSIVFALANPDPEVDPRAARQHATVVATAVRISRTRSTTCWRSRACSGGCST
jgi:malate dehydrogenase (oxaloacetate-decarboxylating)